MKLYMLLTLALILSITGLHAAPPDDDAKITSLEDELNAHADCKKLHDDKNITYETCAQQYECKRLSGVTVHHSVAVPMDMNKECPTNAKDAVVRIKAASLAKKVKTFITKMDPRKTPNNSACWPFGLQPNYASIAVTRIGKFCIVGAECTDAHNAEKHTGVVTCKPKGKEFDYLVTDYDGRQVPFSTCPDFDFCLSQSQRITAPTGLLTYYDRQNNPPLADGTAPVTGSSVVAAKPAHGASTTARRPNADPTLVVKE